MLSLPRLQLAIALAVGIASGAVGLLACSDTNGDLASNTDAAPDTATSTTDAGDLVDGGEDSATADADSAATADASSQEKLICDAYASRAACSGGAIPCDADDKCIYGKIMLPEAATSFAACRGAPSCKGDDYCVAEAGRSVGGAAADQYSADCIARRTQCANAFKDDWCSPGAFAFPGAGPGAQACLAKPCDEIKACIEDLQAIKDIAACK